jgi:uncharacterized protein with PQ loop repeat
MSSHLFHYLKRKSNITIIDRLMTGAAVIHPLTAVPQVYDIYTTHDVAGVSLLTWLSFMVLGLIFLAYGIVHHIRPFILTQMLWFAVDFLVVIGVLMYR